MSNKLLLRLKMAWHCLFSRKVLLFVPRSPRELDSYRAGELISVPEYTNILDFAQHLQDSARRYRGEELRAEALRIAALEAEIATLLKLK